jgi:hypothetical protein
VPKLVVTLFLKTRGNKVRVWVFSKSVFHVFFSEIPDRNPILGHVKWAKNGQELFMGRLIAGGYGYEYYGF